MDFYRAFSSIIERKKTSIYFGSLFMSYGINYGFYKENTKFSKLNSFYCIQWFILNEKLHLLDLLKKYEKWGGYWINHSENWAKQSANYVIWTNTYLSWPRTFITHVKVYQMYLLNHSNVLTVILNQVVAQWALKPILVIHLWKARQPLF